MTYGRATRRSALVAVCGGACGLLIVALAPREARAQEESTAYVADELRITLRSGPGEDYRVQRVLTTGTRLTVSDRKGEWVEVELADGARGWVLDRYISTEIPAREQLPRLQEALDLARERLRALEADRSALEAAVKEVAPLRARASELEEANAELRGSRSVVQMLIGAGIALVGVLVGALWPRGTGRRPLLGSRRRIKL